MVELAIKIPMELYDMVQNKLDFNGDLKHKDVKAIMLAVDDGKLLPKGHGDLVDYEEMKNNARKYGEYAEAILPHIKPITIIEADKG